MRWYFCAAVPFLLNACQTSGSATRPLPATHGSGHMLNCPSAVPGSHTEVSDSADGVNLLVTGTDVSEIRARAQRLLAASKTEARGGHDGKGVGGGGLGKCPAVLAETLVDVSDAQGGVQITLKPEKPESLATLRDEVRARLKELPH